MGDVKDFDAFWREQERRRTGGRVGERFKVYGKEYTLPLDMPAGVMLRLLRVREELGDDAPIPADEAALMAYDIFGRTNVEEWTRQGMGIEKLVDMLAWAMERINNDVGVTAGNRRSRRSKAAGKRTRPPASKRAASKRTRSKASPSSRTGR